MDYRVKTSKDFAINLAHAKAVITACRVAIPPIAVSDEDEAFIRLGRSSERRLPRTPHRRRRTSGW